MLSNFSFFHNSLSKLKRPSGALCKAPSSELNSSLWCGFESCVDQLYKIDLCFCSSHRIFCACSSWIRNMCSFVLVWTSVSFLTSLFKNLSVFSMYILFLAFSSSRSALPSRSSRAWRRESLLAAIFVHCRRGAVGGPGRAWARPHWQLARPIRNKNIK